MIFLMTVLAGLLGVESAEAICAQPRITIIGTNDIHGAVEDKVITLGKTPPIPKNIGGMPFFSGVVSSIRQSAAMNPQCEGVILVDGGDQFQGTLLSNFSEGALMFDLMSEAGYDAVVPGNHDYDFGPSGWLVDQLPAGSRGDPREALKSIARRASFPLLSANTYYMGSLKSISGAPAPVISEYCRPTSSSDIIRWSEARRPEFLRPYIIKNVAGLRVAIIGLDHPETAAVTTRANVSDLCFRDPVEEFISIKAELRGRVDVTVVVMHLGDAGNEFKMTEFLNRVLAQDPRAVDAVIGGHTHYVNDVRVQGVPAIQSGANGEKFGRIDLFFDPAAGAIDRTRTRVFAGKFLFADECDRGNEPVCSSNAGLVQYDGFPVAASPVSRAKIEIARREIAPMAKQLLGQISAPLTRNRTEENNLGNALTDAVRDTFRVDVALLNSGGIRTDLMPGPLDYENFYRVLPFNNRGVRLKPMRVATLVKLFSKSIASCGNFGALNQSGLRVFYEKDCARDVQKLGVDPAARLLRVETITGEPLFDVARTDLNLERTISVVTVDFLAAGGSEFPEFRETQVDADLGILREALAQHFRRQPWNPSPNMDGRLQNVLRRP